MSFDSKELEEQIEKSIKVYKLNLKGECIDKKIDISEIPVVYLLMDGKNIYIGETTNIIIRFRKHNSVEEREMLSVRYAIYSPYFNKSVIQHLEAFLICHFHAEGHLNVINGNLGCNRHSYYQKACLEKPFNIVWKKLCKENIARKTITEINNSDNFKYSPYKSLSSDQQYAILDILENISDKRIIVNGCAGTGKTILAIYLIKLLLTPVKYYDYYKNDDAFVSMVFSQLEKLRKLKIGKYDIVFVVPTDDLRKTLKKVFSEISGLDASMIKSSSEIAKNNHKYKLAIVDETHRLRQRKNLSGGGHYKSFDDCNRSLGLKKNEGTELDWVIQKSYNQILFYDKRQTVRPTDIPAKKFNSIINKKDTFNIHLKTQHRCKGGEKYAKFVFDLMDCKLTGAKKNDLHEFNLFLYQDIRALHKLIKERHTNPNTGLSYLVAGFSWKWDQSKKRKPEITIDGYKLMWNTPKKSFIHSGNAQNEVGCIHTVQGFDMNYVGVIFGEEIYYDNNTKKIKIDSSKYKDINGKNTASEDELIQYITNIYATLLLRGIDGVYVYCCNKNLRDYFSQYIPEYIAVEDKTKNL